VRKIRERALKILSERVGDVKGQRLKSPLLRGHCMVGLPKLGVWVCFCPFSSGKGRKVERGGRCNIVGDGG
jgi:hypothetical protein